MAADKTVRYMRNTYCYFIISIITLCSFLPIEEGTLDIGAPLPKADVQLMDISGQQISLGSSKGANGLLVIFSANSCPYVIRNQARTKEICKYAKQRQLGVVLVNSNEAMRSGEDSPAAMKAYANAQQFEWHYVIDKKSELADAFDARHTPECFLFDRSGMLAYKGAIDDNPGNAEAVKIRHLHNAINDMLAGKAAQVSSAPSMGCNIKRF